MQYDKTARLLVRNRFQPFARVAETGTHCRSDIYDMEGQLFFVRFDRRGREARDLEMPI